MEDKIRRTVEMLNTQLLELSNIFKDAQSESNYTASRERLVRWKERTFKLISSEINPEEGQKLKGKSRGVIYSEPLTNISADVKLYTAFLEALREDFEKHPEDFLYEYEEGEQEFTETHSVDKSMSREVFIIHGHDEPNRLKLEKLLKERWKINPIILSYEPGKGRTLIEKFEQEAQTEVGPILRTG